MKNNDLLKRFGTEDPVEIVDIKKNSKEKDLKVFENVEMTKAIKGDSFKKRLKELGIGYRKELEERQALFTISTEDPDRDGDIVRSAGIDTTDYEKNPIVLFAHDSRSLPIGVSLKIYKSKGKTKSLVMFYDNEIDNTGLSETIYNFVKAGGIKGASIGFRPIEARRPSAEEAKRLGMGEWGVEYVKTQMLEWSVVSLPANQNALRSKGYSEDGINKLKELNLIEEDDLEIPDEAEEYDMNMNDLLEEISTEQKTADEAIILLKDIKNSIDNLNGNISKVMEKIMDPAVKRAETSDSEEDFSDILDLLDKAIENTFDKE